MSLIQGLFTKEQTKNLAILLAKNSAKGDIYFLKGDLGAGKTTFSKAFIQSFFNYPITVTSPTFTLFNLYESDSLTLCHSDLYRLKSVEELYELGLLELLDTSLTLIEWPDLLEEAFSTLQVNKLTFSIKDDATRLITLTSNKTLPKDVIHAFTTTSF